MNQEAKDICLIRRCLYDFLKSMKLNKTELTKKYYADWILTRLTKEGFLKFIKIRYGPKFNLMTFQQFVIV